MSRTPGPADEARNADEARKADPPRAAWGIPFGAIGGGVLALVVALRLGRGPGGDLVPGLPDAGLLTRWALPLARGGVDAAAAVTVGHAIAAAFLLPGPHPVGATGTSMTGTAGADDLSAAGWRMIRRVSWAAFGWAAATVALLVLVASDILAVAPGSVGLRPLGMFVTSVATGQALAEK